METTDTTDTTEIKSPAQPATPSWSHRRVLATGSLMFALLLGIGLWPTPVSTTRTEETNWIPQGNGEAVGPNGGVLVTWSASAGCSILLGTTRASTENRPAGSFMQEGGLCGEPTQSRTLLILALLLTAVATLVAWVWQFDVFDSVEPST